MNGVFCLIITTTQCSFDDFIETFNDKTKQKSKHYKEILGDTGKHYQTSCLTLYALIDSSFWFEIISLGESILYIEGSQVILNCIRRLFQCITIIRVYTETILPVDCFSVDPDEMPHHVAFKLGLHCLPKYAVKGSGVCLYFKGSLPTLVLNGFLFLIPNLYLGAPFNW